MAEWLAGRNLRGRNVHFRLGRILNSSSFFALHHFLTSKFVQQKERATRIRDNTLFLSARTHFLPVWALNLIWLRVYFQVNAHYYNHCAACQPVIFVPGCAWRAQWTVVPDCASYDGHMHYISSACGWWTRATLHCVPSDRLYASYLCVWGLLRALLTDGSMMCR